MTENTHSHTSSNKHDHDLYDYSIERAVAGTPRHARSGGDDGLLAKEHQCRRGGNGGERAPRATRLESFGEQLEERDVQHRARGEAQAERLYGDERVDKLVRRHGEQRLVRVRVRVRARARPNPNPNPNQG